MNELMNPELKARRTIFFLIFLFQMFSSDQITSFFLDAHFSKQQIPNKKNDKEFSFVYSEILVIIYYKMRLIEIYFYQIKYSQKRIKKVQVTLS